MAVFAKKEKIEKEGSEGASLKNSFIFEILKASILALLISLILSLVAALIMSFVNYSDLVAEIINQSIRGVSVLAACFFSFKTKSKGWLKGLLSALIFCVLSFLVSSLIGGSFVFGLALLIDIATGVAMGVISGIISVNIRK